MLPAGFMEDIGRRPEEDLVQLHFGLGLWLRNHWGLWAGSRLAAWFVAQGVSHPDDMSAIILVSFHRHLNGRPVDLAAQVAHYQAWWAAQGGGGRALISPPGSSLERPIWLATAWVA